MLSLLLLSFACAPEAEDPADADSDGTADAYDCGPSNPAMHPDADELCNGLDDNCDGTVDEGATLDTWPDQDGDGFGASGSPRNGCPIAGWAENSSDCDDQDAAVNPAATDVCNGIDDDCDGNADVADGTWFADLDGDGFGDDASAVQTCSPEAGWILQGGDCNDADATINPGEAEACNSRDDDCDGAADLGYEADWYSDDDGDGYGSPLEHELTCTPQAGWVLDSSDCRPGDPAAFPGAAEACNGADDSCDGVVDEGFDVDGDGHYDAVCSFGDDCDDLDPESYQGALEVCGDLVDQDCTGYDLHCGYEGTYDLANAAVRASTPPVSSAGGHVDVGDVNADGYDDLVLNSIYDGLVVVPGPLSGAVDISAVGTAFTGNMASVYGGRSIGAGDVDGDGLADVGFGAPYGTFDALYIQYGPADADLEGENADARLSGSWGSMCGHGADIAEVTGDSTEDAVVGCYSDYSFGGAGVVYVFTGPLSGEADKDDASATLYATSRSDYAGRWVRGDGDLNGDGSNDLLVAAPYATGGAPYSGIIYVLLGPVSGEIALPSSDARILGSTVNGYLGEYRTLIMGDSNGDGNDDALVSAYANGDVALFLSPTSGDYSMSTPDIAITGSGYFGSGLDLQDIDGNGAGEVLVSNGYESSGAGASYLFWDLAAGTYTSADANGVFNGEAGSYAGTSSTFADMTGDGWADVVVTAQALDSSGGFYVEEQVR